MSVPTPGDNLGDHTATNDLDLAGFDLGNVGAYRFAGHDVYVQGGTWTNGMSAPWLASPTFNGGAAAGLVPWGGNEGDLLTLEGAWWVPRPPPPVLFPTNQLGDPELATTFLPFAFVVDDPFSSMVGMQYTQTFAAASGLVEWRCETGYSVYVIRPAKTTADAQRSDAGPPDGLWTNPPAACWLWGNVNPAEPPGFPAGWSFDPAGRGPWVSRSEGITAMDVVGIVNHVRTVQVSTVELRFLNGAFTEAVPIP